MGEKKSTSVSIDESLLQEVRDRRGLNLSGLVNEFLQDYLAFGDAAEAHLEARLSHLQQREDQLEDELDSVREEIDYVEARLEDIGTDDDDSVDEQIDAMLHDFPSGEHLRVENPAILTWARKLEVEPSWLVEEIEDRRQEQGDPDLKSVAD
jgi:hypothetical protein